jgi:hypothetical protein
MLPLGLLKFPAAPYFSLLPFTFSVALHLDRQQKRIPDLENSLYLTTQPKKIEEKCSKPLLNPLCSAICCPAALLPLKPE